ncbi:MAG TPA: hypothetical protein VFK03_04640, partial [Candidatus Saccharimonadales bacterium]|nr:hypothetical protein [Candidatus Saccharimonadales bacterium]
MATLFSSQTAFAADAVWKNDTTISYGGNDYTKGGSVIGKDWTLYSGKKDSHNCSSAIYFEKGVDIDNATSAKFWPGTYVRGAMGSGHCDHGDAKTISLKPLKSGTGTTDGEGGGKDEPDVNCDAGSWTFMVCPFITSTQTVLKKLFEMIADLSYFQPLPIGAPQKGAEWAIYYGWSTFLTFANIAAVIGFLVIIFSQATSIGLSSYGVKKLLPKMILVMLLMNVSYYLCAIAIDISNIIGAAINDIFNYIYSRVTNKLDPTAVNGGFGSGAVMGWFGGAVELAIIVAFFLVPVLITLLVIFGVLAARIAILTLLVIIAPLAFAAWILPNTEKYFKKWWSLFFDMLALYPVLMAVYGGATLAANILML